VSLGSKMLRETFPPHHTMDSGKRDHEDCTVKIETTKNSARKIKMALETGGNLGFS